MEASYCRTSRGCRSRGPHSGRAHCEWGGLPRLTIAGLLALASTGYAAAQPAFHVQAKVVQLAVTVSGRDGRSVDGLLARDFQILDNGVRQHAAVDDFSSGLPAISLVAAIQTAGISKPALVSVRRIGGMLQPLIVGARGEVAIVAYDSRVRWLQDFTRDDDQIRAAVKNLKSESGSQARMLDAVSAAADHLRERSGRKILLLIGETRDRGSETKFEQALNAIERQGIQVYASHYSAYATSLISKSRDQPDAPPSGPESANPEEPPN